jgi:hypothetical protein
MKLNPLVFIGLILLPSAPLAAQTVQTADQTRAQARLEERIKVLERDLETSRRKYARLDDLFRRTVAVTQSVLDNSAELTPEVRQFMEETRSLKDDIDNTLAESGLIIDYLKNNVAERPCFLVEIEIAWHILLGGSLGCAFVWEPLPWLGLKAGAELWYTDAFRAAFPVSLRLRLRLD